MAEKRYYWLKLNEDYLTSPKIKKLRRIAGGDTYTIIYLKMQLLSISNKGIIEFEGIESTIEEELALKLDEQVEDVQLTLAYLTNQGLVETNNNQYLLVEACNNIGSECDSAERVRKFRENKQKSLQCNGIVTEVKRSSISISESISKEEDIFNYYNSKNIIKHKELTEDIKKSITKSLKLYSVENLKIYIDRYAKVIKDSRYFFDYKWGLKDLLDRKNGISSFTDDGSKWVDYCNKVGISSSEMPQEEKQVKVDNNGVFSI